MTRIARLTLRFVLALMVLGAMSPVLSVFPAGAQSGPVVIASPDPVGAGEVVSIRGQGFLPGEQVSIEFAGPTLATAVADNNGAFVTSGTVDPSVPVGAHPLDANGDMGSWTTIDLTVAPAPLPPPSNPAIHFIDGVAAGGSVVVSGSGFHPGEQVSIHFAGDTLGSTMATGAGDFSLSVTVPMHVPVGSHPLDVIGSLGSSVDDDLTVQAPVVTTTTTPPTTTTVPAPTVSTPPPSPTTTVPAPAGPAAAPSAPAPTTTTTLAPVAVATVADTAADIVAEPASPNAAERPDLGLRDQVRQATDTGSTTAGQADETTAAQEKAPVTADAAPTDEAAAAIAPGPSTENGRSGRSVALLATLGLAIVLGLVALGLHLHERRTA